MNIQEYYDVADEFPSLKLLIEFLVNEKKVLKMTDNESELKHYLQDKFHKKMNEHLQIYEGERNGKVKSG